MPLHSLDYVVDEVIGREFITRRTLMENLRPGRKYAGCARKVGNHWAFTAEDIDRLLERMRTVDDPMSTQHRERPQPVQRTASGISTRSPRVRGRQRWV